MFRKYFRNFFFKLTFLKLLIVLELGHKVRIYKMRIMWANSPNFRVSVQLFARYLGDCFSSVQIVMVSRLFIGRGELWVAGIVLIKGVRKKLICISFCVCLMQERIGCLKFFYPPQKKLEIVGPHFLKMFDEQKTCFDEKAKI